MSTSIEDNELPKAILTRIMKQVLPENTNIQANAKVAMTKSTTLFINYLASAANEVASNAGHKIVSGTHVLNALESLDLEEMIPRLEEELKSFQAIQKSRKEGAAKTTKDKDDSAAESASKKRKPTAEGPKSVSKARKSSTNANPRDAQDNSPEGAGDDEEMDEDRDVERDEDDEEDGEAEAEAEAGDDNNGVSLNMDEGEQDIDEEKVSHMDEEEDDSDGF
ncbi:histone-fold-containing protein [Gamsiella multidivaricata]|uniref:histone-fold-containing protein n=1 Tax=Gamsiella multidivaricata TaxID=101098 RepID=UPI0022209932|nr:histone-fold-containing protein [Gamsiella multidivaricata]KAG0354918.1 hypothetical protein BGZ54_001410 [Gamsiella multidivaricata]KAI7820458.1 histone-fold-containing protein [Gamsiella multidivaricata]